MELPKYFQVRTILAAAELHTLHNHPSLEAISDELNPLGERGGWCTTLWKKTGSCSNMWDGGGRSSGHIKSCPLNKNGGLRFWESSSTQVPWSSRYLLRHTPPELYPSNTTALYPRLDVSKQHYTMWSFWTLQSLARQRGRVTHIQHAKCFECSRINKLFHTPTFFLLCSCNEFACTISA
jgi:hypothetical protein